MKRRSVKIVDPWLTNGKSADRHQATGERYFVLSVAIPSADIERIDNMGEYREQDELFGLFNSVPGIAGRLPFYVKVVWLLTAQRDQFKSNHDSINVEGGNPGSLLKIPKRMGSRYREHFIGGARGFEPLSRE